MATFVSGARRSILARTHTQWILFDWKKGELALARVVITRQSVDSEQIAISGGTNSSLAPRKDSGAESC
jgi:hypothetical protein